MDVTFIGAEAFSSYRVKGWGRARGGGGLQNERLQFDI
jgi:hypothetical protein